nr:lysophospholipid acyltransferase family protein [Loktanella sp. F6476L]
MPAIGLIGWFHIVRRGVPLILMIAVCLVLLLVVRLIEAPIWKAKRPITPFITQFVCKNAFYIMGIRHEVQGTVMRGPGAVVANHVSWLDIFALNATKRIYFVSKSEVAKWPGIGWLARATGTVFIQRDRKSAKTQVSVFQERLRAGHKLLFFPEGTSTDGLQVLGFKPTLFAAFFDDDLRETMRIQPVTVKYIPDDSSDPRIYGWWGDMDFGPHLLATLAATRQGAVSVRYHEPVKVRDFANRKDLSLAVENAVRAGLSHDRCT